MIHSSFGGTVAGIRTLSETNCLGLNIHTQELSDEEQSKLLKIRNLYCEIELKADNFTEEASLIEIAKQTGRKMTRSQELRFWLKLLWEVEKSAEDFDLYYDHHMKKIIDFVKQKKQKAENPL